MKYLQRSVIFIILTVMLSSPLFAITVKLGSLVPGSSPWGTSLKRMAGEWKKISNGKVILKIYPGGIAGDESDMIRKMKFGQLHASAMTAIGISHIFRGAFSIQVPFLYKNDKEMMYVIKKMKPYLKENLKKKGFEILTWSDTGRMHFFSRYKIVSPDDLMKQKLFLWEGDPDMVRAWQELGFHPVPLSANEIQISLQTGMVDSLILSPTVAASYQIFTIARHMCEMELAPFLGGIIVSTKTWRKIPSDLQPKLKKAVEDIGKQMQARTKKDDAKYLAFMRKKGLKTHSVSAKIRADWMKMANDGYKKLIGKSLHKESYEMVKKYIAQYRKKYGK